VRLIKAFALAAIPVGAFMAFLGASSASAVTTLEKVVLCKVLESPCQAANIVPQGTVIHGTASDKLLLGPSFNVLCAQSALLGTTTSTLAHWKIESLSLTNCSRTDNGSACTVTAKGLPYLAKSELQANDTNYETLVTEIPPGNRPRYEVACSGLTCTYGAATVLLEEEHVSGVTFLKLLQNLEGEGFCGLLGSGVWHALYEIKCLLPAGTAVNCYSAME
jgi:hypothetical protein